MTNLLKEKIAQTRKAPNTCVLDALLSAKRAKIDDGIVADDGGREEDHDTVSDCSMNPSSPDDSNLPPKSDDPENIDSSFNAADKVDRSESASNLTIDLPNNAAANLSPSVDKDSNLASAIQGATAASDGSVPAGLVDPNGSYFACSTCPKYFLNESNLKHHNSLYHSEKSFTCEICGKAFRFRSNLAEHRSVHTSLKPYVCKFCGKSSRLKGNLTKHILKHHKKEQSDFIGKDDIIIRKGKKSIKDPAAVDFLEKSMIVLTPDSMNSAALHLFNLAGGNKSPASSNNGKMSVTAANVNDNGSCADNNLRRRKMKSRARPCHNGQVSLDNNENCVGSQLIDSPCAGNTELITEKMMPAPIFSHSPRFSNPVNHLTPSSYSDQLSMVNDISPTINRITSTTTPHQQLPPPPGSKFFPAATLPVAAGHNALTAASLIPSNFQFLNFDHLFFALNKMDSTPALGKFATGQQFISGRNTDQDCRNDGQVELRSSRFDSDNETEDEGKRSVNEVVASIGVGNSKAYQSGGAPSSCVNGTKCDTCGKHFRKSTNLAAHLAAKHGVLSVTSTSCTQDAVDGNVHQAATPRNNFASGIVNESSFTSCSTPHFYESMKMNRNAARKISNTVSELPSSGKEKFASINGCDFSKSNFSSPSYDQNHVENVLVKNAREMREILDEFRRQQKSTTASSDSHRQNQQQQNIDSNALLSNLEAKVGRIESQVEISLATLYSLVQMQTEMNLAFFQFKSDVYEQLRLLQNLLKNYRNSSPTK